MLEESCRCNCKMPVVAFACWTCVFIGGQRTMQVGGLLVGLEVCSDLGTSLSLSWQDHWSSIEAILMHPATLERDFGGAFHHHSDMFSIGICALQVQPPFETLDLQVVAVPCLEDSGRICKFVTSGWPLFVVQRVQRVSFMNKKW